MSTQNKPKTKGIIIISVIVLFAAIGTAIALLLMNGWQNGGTKPDPAATDTAAERNIDYYSDKRIGVMTGSIYEGIVRKSMPEASISFFDKAADMADAVVKGQIDAFICSDIQAKALIAESGNIKILGSLDERSEIAFAFPKTEHGVDLRDEFNEYLAKIRSDGTYDLLVEKWKDGGDKTVEITVTDNAKGVLKMATTGTTEPYTYMSEGRLTGFDIDLAASFSREYGYDLDIRVMEFGLIIPGLSSEEFDIAGANITVTDERAESVYFSDSYTSNGTAMVVANN